MPAYLSKAIYSAAYQEDITGITNTTIGDGFVLVGTQARWSRYNINHGVSDVGTTGGGIGTHNYLLSLGGSASGGHVKLNAGNIIPAETLVELEFWAIAASADHDDNGNGITIGHKSNKMESDEFVRLEQADNTNFSSGLATVPAKFRKSTTTAGPGDTNTILSSNGTITQPEMSVDDGFGSGGTFHHFQIAFTVPSGGKFYRLASHGTGGENDHVYHHNMKVRMSPPTITSAEAASQTFRTVYVNESNPSHASVSLGSATTAQSISHRPFDDEYGGSPEVLSSSGVTFNPSDGKFTVPDGGMYEITVVGHIANTSDGNGLSQFNLVEGVGTSGRRTLISTSPAIHIASNNQRQASYVLHGIFRLNANKTVTLLVNTTSTGTVSLEAGSTFSIIRIS